MTFENEEAAEACNAPTADSQDRTSPDTKRIKQEERDGKDTALADLSKEPWVWRKALMRADLPASAFRVAIAILDVFMNKKTGTCIPSQDTLANETMLSLSGVRKGLSALRAAGFLTSAKMKFNGSLHYMLAIPTTSRSIPNGAVREPDEVTQTGYTNCPKQDTRSDPNRAVEVTHLGHLTYRNNLGTEHEDLTSDQSSSCCPADLVAIAPLSRSVFDRSIEQSAYDQRDGELSYFSDLEENEELVIDETRLRDERYLWRWLNQNVPDKSQWPTIMNLGRAGELSPQHLRRAAL